MKIYLRLFLIELCFLFSSCSNKETSPYLLIENPTEKMVDVKQGMNDLFESIRYVQLDSVSMIKARGVTLLDSLIMVKTDLGVYLYDMNGTFVRKIGEIGQGPEEYNNLYTPLWDGVRKRIYVYTKPAALLTYTLTGEFLKRVTVEIPSDYTVRSTAYCLDHFYFMNLAFWEPDNNALWLKVDTLGQVVGSKDSDLLNENVAGEKGFVIGGNYSSSSDSTIIYANHYSDSIYRISTDKSEVIAVWDKGDFRLTQENSASTFEMNSKIIFQGVGETRRWLIMRWYMPLKNKQHEEYLTYYDKKECKGRTIKEIVPAHNAYFCSQNNVNYLVYLCEPENLICWLLSSDDLEQQKRGREIDPEGNPVLILMQLKDE